jgi:hypothetical protein
MTMFQLRPIFDGSDKDYISKGSNIRRNIDDFCFVDPSLSYQYLLIKKDNKFQEIKLIIIGHWCEGLNLLKHESHGFCTTCLSINSSI